MFDIAWSELLIVGVVAILVVGPKELPGMLRTLGRMLGKLRSTANDFRRHFDEAVREAGGEDLQREIHSLRSNNPMTKLRDTIEEATREPPAVRAPTASAPPEPPAGDAGDLGPPPPLPPKVASTALSDEQAGKPADTHAAHAVTDDTDVSSDIRLNGEHRTLN
jgi:sec-independent protein translocase protein TatB